MIVYAPPTLGDLVEGLLDRLERTPASDPFWRTLAGVREEEEEDGDDGTESSGG